MPKHRFSRRRTWRVVALAGVFLALAAVSTGLYLRSSSAASYATHREAESATRSSNTSLVTSTMASAGSAVRFGMSNPKVGGCIAPANLPRSADVIDEAAGEPMPAWRHKYGDAAIIYVNTSGLNSEYAGYVQQGITTWNASPCIEYRAVTACPANSNCITTQMIASTPDGGNWDGRLSTRWVGNGPDDGYISSATMTLVTGKLNQQTVAYRRMVVVHEMGHGVSLDHRKTRADIMYSGSTASASLIADLINRNNILALYGFNLRATREPLPSGTLYGTANAGNAAGPADREPEPPEQEVVRY